MLKFEIFELRMKYMDKRAIVISRNRLFF